MRRIILLSIILLFLTGCGGIYNLGNFILPNDVEFILLIKELNTPQKIGNYMEENFVYESHDYALSPFELWKIGKGDCNDFSAFGVLMAQQNGIGNYQIKIFYHDIIGKHWIAVYIEDNYYSITNNRIYLWGFDTFKQIVMVDSLLFKRNWKKYLVYDYYYNIIEKGEK